ncbi:MAG: outer membrane beta-barrel protein [Thioalkalispiraceae bacterium]|jgi:hypothetical protein
MKYIALLLPLLAALYTTEVHAAAGDTQFKQGLTAFKKGDYNKALTAFKKAEQAGMRSAALNYNLGVVYYKTGKLEQAKTYFTRLRKNRKLAQVANYNLGLIAEREDNNSIALQHYRIALKGSDKDIQELANYRISKLKQRAKVNVWYGMASLVLGHDDNVTLIPNDSPTQMSDNYLEAFAYASYIVNQQLSFNVSYDWLNYNDVDVADFSQLMGGVDYRLQYGQWQLIPGLRYSQSTLNSSSYQHIIDLRLTGRQQLSRDRKVTLRYRYNDIQSQNALYDYLEGTRQQFRADYDLGFNLHDLRLRYQLELNDRQNLPTANYSPTRHTLQARMKYRLNTQWRLEGTAEYRNSRYGDAAGTSREDDRYRLRAGANYLYNREWDVRLRYTYTDNQSTLATESYTRNDIQAQVNYSF